MQQKLSCGGFFEVNSTLGLNVDKVFKEGLDFIYFGAKFEFFANFGGEETLDLPFAPILD